MLLILEDNKTRSSAFERAMALSHPTLLLKIWTNAPAMIASHVMRLSGSPWLT